jgi:hypothetical protein
MLMKMDKLHIILIKKDFMSPYRFGLQKNTVKAYHYVL